MICTRRVLTEAGQGRGPMSLCGSSAWAVRWQNVCRRRGLSVMGEDTAGQEAAKPRKRGAAKTPVRVRLYEGEVHDPFIRRSISAS